MIIVGRIASKVSKVDRARLKRAWADIASGMPSDICLKGGSYNGKHHFWHVNYAKRQEKGNEIHRPKGYRIHYMYKWGTGSHRTLFGYTPKNAKNDLIQQGTVEHTKQMMFSNL